MKEEFVAIAALINDIYFEEFGGKTRGRFFLTKDQLKQISGRSTLQKSTEDAIFAAAFKLHALSLVRVDGGYGVIEQAKPAAWRPVPARLINRLTRTAT